METPESEEVNKVEDVKQTVTEQDRLACFNEIQAILDKYRCLLDAQMLITQSGIKSNIAIIAKD